MKEIGGYIEFEHFHGKMLYGDGIKLDCGRSCLGYLIKANSIKRLGMPSFMCDAVFNLCSRYDVELDFYNVDYDFKPVDPVLCDDCYLYLCNYYGQLTEEDIIRYHKKYHHIIVDNTQAYFSPPVSGIDTLYTCRKYFGVPDGGILFTSALIPDHIVRSESFEHMTYLLGRFERNASEFYELSTFNNDRFEDQRIMRMSKLTENLLHGIDYALVKKRRESNFLALHEAFGNINRLNLSVPEGPFSYPLLVYDASRIRRELIKEKIYIPVLWPNVVGAKESNMIDRDLALNILPLPCDQRYDVQDMLYMIEKIALFL